MSRFFTILKNAVHLLPASVRESKPLQQLSLRLLEKPGDIDDIYSARYYQTLVEPYARRSTPQMAASIHETFHPQSVIDVGCGSGALLVELRKLGIRDLLGLDCADAGLDIARARGLDTQKFNIITDRWTDDRHFDLAVSMETAEHLPASAADRYVELLCQLAPIVILTAAHPGQGGIGHKNEQPPEYWKSLFAEHGFQCLEQTVANWQPAWKNAGVADFYTRNLMIFQRG